MKTEFYRSRSGAATNVSLVLAASLAGTVTGDADRPAATAAQPGCTVYLTPYQHSYYHPGGQMRALERGDAVLRELVERLIRVTEDTPQSIVDIVNDHFWDMV